MIFRNLINKILSPYTSSSKIAEKISSDVIKNAYKTRKKEIESLKQYDRGEKEIVTPDLKRIVRSL